MERCSFFKQKNQQGITLLEILAVLVIIALVFIALSRNLGFGSDRAKKTDVQQAMKPYQTAFENSITEYSGVPSQNGVNADYVTLNRYLGQDYQLQNPINGTGNTHPTSNPVQTSKLKDPWGNLYKVQAKVISAKESHLIFRSTGADKQSTSSTDLFSNTQETTDKDDLIFLTTYKDGLVKSCTNGFEKNVGSFRNSGAGVSLPTVDVDVPLGTRETFKNSYSYEYAITAQINEYNNNKTVRTYVYSNSPLNLSTYQTVDGLKWYVKDVNNLSFVGFEMWETIDDSMGFEFNTLTAPTPFTTPKTTMGYMYKEDNEYRLPSYIIRTDLMETVPPNTVLGCE